MMTTMDMGGGVGVGMTTTAGRDGREIEEDLFSFVLGVFSQ